MDTPLGLASPSRLNLRNTPFNGSPSSILKPRPTPTTTKPQPHDELDEDFDPFLPRPKVPTSPKRSPTKTGPLRDNEGLTRYMNTPAEDTMDLDDIDMNVGEQTSGSPLDADTSGFSAFSTIAFSPTKHLPEMRQQTQTPRRDKTGKADTPGTVRARPKEREETQLLEFTEQFDVPAKHASPTRTRDVFATPMTRPTTARQNANQNQTYGVGNLLDFDVPVLTPGSRPSVTLKEVESLKNEHRLEVEKIREGAASQRSAFEKSLEQARKEKDELSKHAEEMKTVHEREFQSLQSAYISLQKESQRQMQVLRDLLSSKDNEMSELKTSLKDSETKCSEAETRADTLDSKLAGYEAEHAAASAPGDVSTPGSGANKALNAAVEKVARELHALYKGKHGTKVEALKKSYESRYQKQMGEMQERIDALMREKEELATQRAPNETCRDDVRIAEMEQTIQGKEEIVRDLQEQLARSREENSELVAAVDEMLSLQSTQTQTQPLDSLPPSTASMSETRSPRRPPVSGLRGPGGIPAPSGLKKPASAMAMAGKSGIMSNIERMGRGRAVPSGSSATSS